MVPVRRTSDGVLGMLDLAQGGFYSNSGTGTFTAGTNVATAAGGELRIITAENATNSCTVTLTGGLKLVKDGAGTLVMEKASQAYFGGTEIAEGVLKSGTGLAKSCGVVGAWIVASVSGTVDFNGNANMQSYRYDFADGAKALNGGAAISSGAFSFTSFYTPVSTGTFTASLASGATLDLTEWNGAWPIANVTAPAGTAESPTAVTLKVDMDAETFRNLAMSRDAETGKRNGYMLTFGGARPANVNFTPDSASAGRCRLLEDENGDIILAFKPGLTIIVK
jgi:autotransporter-associated beta strand protein